MSKKQRLELTWIGKDNQPKLEPRILIEDPEKSYGDKNSKNMLIYGDNLLALKALEQDFAGKIKCIYIDPPYNTGSAFESYDDGLEHSIWLSLIRDRLVVLKALLRDDGSIWISIDDNECHYLKILCDEIFGRNNFIANIVWQKFHSVKTNAQYGISQTHDHVLMYRKSERLSNFNLLDMDEDALEVYKNRDNDPRGRWRTAPLTVSLLSGQRGAAYAKTGKSTGLYEIIAPNGKRHLPSKGRCWIAKNTIDELIADNRIWWGKDGNAVPMRKLFLSEKGAKKICNTFWSHREAGSNKRANEQMKALFPNINSFSTPKPEELLYRIIHLASDADDIVLDSFLGSGTTAAVAHKMGRRWIGIELGEHCHTHCLPRLQKVADGTDQGGISKSVTWKGGGGFKYYYLAPSLLKEDKHGNWVIDEQYNADMLAAAMAKHEGFKYNPDEDIYWKQGQSTEKDFIFTTTRFVTVETLDKIREEMKPGESLLICCKSFQKACENQYPEITVKKIPGMLLGRCEFGRDDYSFNIVAMPVDPDAPDFVPAGPGKETTGKKKKNAMEQGKLFD